MTKGPDILGNQRTNWSDVILNKNQSKTKFVCSFETSCQITLSRKVHYCW